MKAKVPQNDVG